MPTQLDPAELQALEAEQRHAAELASAWAALTEYAAAVVRRLPPLAADALAVALYRLRHDGERRELNLGLCAGLIEAAYLRAEVDEQGRAELGGLAHVLYVYRCSQ